MRTMIFYEAPHKLLRTLEDMKEYFGGDRPIAVVREITKLHEQTLRTTLDGALAHFTETPPKGEFVLVVEGAPQAEEAPMTLEDAAEAARRFVEEGMSASEAAKKAAAASGFKKGDIYRLLQN